MDRFTNLESAYNLYVDLCCNLDHLEHALELLHDGEFQAAHWALWSACVCKTSPEEAGKTALLRRARKRVAGRKQATIFDYLERNDAS